jgi:hypothetical protein
MVRALGAAMLLLTVTSAARAEEPARAPSTVGFTPTQPAAPSASATSPSSDERTFAQELERFARLRAFTERLMAKREAEAFEQAALRQTRIAKLQRELTEREAAMSEREFDEAVALYLKKRELTRELTAARAKTAPAGSARPAPAAPAPSR